MLLWGEVSWFSLVQEQYVVKVSSVCNERNVHLHVVPRVEVEIARRTIVSPLEGGINLDLCIICSILSKDSVLRTE